MAKQLQRETLIRFDLISVSQGAMRFGKIRTEAAKDGDAKTALPFLLMELCAAQLQAQTAMRFGKTPWMAAKDGGWYQLWSCALRNSKLKIRMDADF